MLFGTSQKLAKIDQFSITINGSVVRLVTAFKYLGVIFVEHLSWNEYVKAIVSKAGGRVGLLGRVRRCITTHSANANFLSIARPILECGVWACCWDVNSGTLEALQKRAGRTVVKTSSSDIAMNRRDEHIFKRMRN